MAIAKPCPDRSKKDGHFDSVPGILIWHLRAGNSKCANRVRVENATVRTLHYLIRSKRDEIRAPNLRHDPEDGPHDLGEGLPAKGVLQEVTISEQLFLPDLLEFQTNFIE